MWKYKFIGLALFLKSLIGKFDFEASRLDMPQSGKYFSIEKLGSVDIQELSGLTPYNGNFLSITDSGGKEMVYILNTRPALLDSIVVENARNIDWEAITSDKSGNIFIADIGNNLNRRKGLRIYKLQDNKIDTISISYKQQEAFPPSAGDSNFDSEAIFWYNGKLHLFSKNRGLKCVKHYILSDGEGKYELLPSEELRLNSMITGAAVNENGDMAVLSGYGKLYFFKMDGEMLFSNPQLLIETTRFGQNEAVAFIDDNNVLVVNEAGKFFKVTFTLPEKK